MRFPDRTEKNRKENTAVSLLGSHKKINLGIQPRQFLIPFSKKTWGITDFLESFNFKINDYFFITG